MLGEREVIFAVDCCVVRVQNVPGESSRLEARRPPLKKGGRIIAIVNVWKRERTLSAWWGVEEQGR